MKSIIHFTVVLAICLFRPFCAYGLNECDVPAFLNVSPPPNLLIGFDNSGSMYDLAYKRDGAYCYDNTYDNAKSYYGYYDNTTVYSYNSGKFQAAASMPSGGCTNISGTEYFCIQKNQNLFHFKGNFLNWLTMSKLDLMKKAMTGGKYESSTLIGESRGCMGRRFVKDVVGSKIAFALLGTVEFGSGGEYGKVYSGGTTRIEIYDAPIGGFNFGACNDVITCLMGNQQGCLKQSTDECLGLSSKSHEIGSFNHSMHYCWYLGKQGQEPSGDGSVNSNKNACENVYTKVPLAPNLIDTTSGAYVCSDNYIGKCYLTDWNDTCIRKELQNYCGILEIPEVIDPSIYLEGGGTYSNAPAILIDSGIVGQMETPMAVLNNIKEQSTVPTGILHDLKDRANIGLIAYNNYGSKYEGVAPTDYYYLTADSDGAKVFSNVQENNTEIIGKFNELTGYAWTPIGELLYESAKYLSGKGSAYNSGVSYTCPVSKTCQKNLVLFLSDGGSTYDRNLPGTSFTGTVGAVTDSTLNVETYLAKIPEAAQNLAFGGTNYAKAVAYWAHELDFNTSMDKTQSIDFYTVFTLGGTTGNSLLQDIAKYGGYKEIDGITGLTSGDTWDAKTNGVTNNTTPDGLPDNYFEVRDPDKLSSDLKFLLSEILEEQGGAGAVATVTQQVGTGDIIVRGAFTTYDVNPKELSWKGHLESYWPYDGCSTISDGTTCQAIPGCTWNGPSTTCSGKMYSFQHPTNYSKFCSDMGADKNCWDAESNLPAPSGRNIFTVLLGEKAAGKSYLARQDFMATNTELCNDTNDWLALTGDSLKGASSLSDACKNLVNWVRGAEPSTTDPVWRYRNNWTLGDIVYSTPVVVEQPSLGSVAKTAVGECATACASGCSDSTPDSDCEKHCFYCYREVHKHRKKMIYVGANDGMLHAFVAGKWNGTKWVFDPAEDTEIGKESWAYIPSNLLPELKDLAKKSYGTETCWHRFMVDLSPQARDVYIDADGDGVKEWRTVVLGGERQGGDVYFAVDVTDPENPKVLWEYSVLRNMVQLQGNTGTKEAVAPYLPLATYKKANSLPATWSHPTVGRLTIPDGIEFWAWPKTYAPTEADPASDPIPVIWRNTGTYELSDWFAFIGGAVRIFDPVNDLPAELTVDQRKATIKPYFMAIDLEKGINIFQHLWPMLHHGTTSETTWSYRTDNASGTNIIPYAMTGPVALDINQDGDVDHIYMGDLNGQFTSLRFNLSDTAATKGVKMDIWPMKTIPSPDDSSNIFRSGRQPIGALPALAFDKDPITSKYRLRAYFGTGKYDDVIGAKSDKTDTAKMSFYNLLVDSEPRKLTAVSSSGALVATFAGNSFTVSGDPLANGLSAGGFVIEPKLESAIPTTTPPTGVTNPNYPHTVLDFGIAGERVVDMALVAGKLVFFLTFVPSIDDCAAGGDAYLYILNYTGNPLSKDPLDGSGFIKKADGTSPSSLKVGEYTKTDNKTYVAKVSESGVPSQPVLDSSNQYVLIQTSDAKIHKIKVNLEGSPLTIKGWKEEELENP